MSTHQEQSIQSEPVDTGTDPVQSEGTPSDSTALVKAKARGSLDGHALPEALSNLAPAFRSHPVWLLVYKWTIQVIEDHQNTKQELAEAKRRLEAAQSDLFDIKIKNVELAQKLDGVGRISTYKTRWQAMGTLFLGLSPAAYLNTFPIYGFLLAGVGGLFLYFAWREDAGK